VQEPALGKCNCHSIVFPQNSFPLCLTLGVPAILLAGNFTMGQNLLGRPKKICKNSHCKISDLVFTQVYQQ